MAAKLRGILPILPDTYMAKLNRKILGYGALLAALTFVTLFCIPVSSVRSRVERDYPLQLPPDAVVLSHSTGLQGPLGKYASGSLHTEIKLSEAAYESWIPRAWFLPGLPRKVGQTIWSYTNLAGMDYTVSWATRQSDGSITLTMNSGLY